METYIDFPSITNLFKQAVSNKRSFLYEHEVYEFIEMIGGETPPKYFFLPASQRLEPENLTSIPSSNVVIKVVSPFILHKSDVGGVQVCANNIEAILSTIRRMSFEIPESYSRNLLANQQSVPEQYKHKEAFELKTAIESDIQGYLICQYVEPDSKEFGNELLISLRNTREFGIVLSAGLGGRDTELYAARFRKGQAVVSAAVELVDGIRFFELFKQTISYKKLAGLTRGQKRIVTDAQLQECFEAMIQVGRHFSPADQGSDVTIEELEVNPFAFSNYLMMPLDGLCKFSTIKKKKQEIDSEMIEKLLHPNSIGIIGISATKENIGKIILRNILANGFERNKITLIHPTSAKIEGIVSLPDISDIPTPLDLLVVAIEGSKLPILIKTVLDNNLASSIILVSGSLGDSFGQSRQVTAAKDLQDTISSYRSRQNTCPVFLGENSLGILSHPGRYDALFIPDSKLPKQRGQHTRTTAIVSQSGAYMITRMSKLSFFDPAYAISIGNQLDITAGDILNYLNTLDSIKTLAFYIEGFTDLDGHYFAKAVEQSILLGKEVIFYKAGRTQEGKDALSGHTASIAGDYMVCDGCMSQAGAMVAETFSIFEGLLRLSSTLYNKKIKGSGLAAISNAGYEAVGIADNIIGEGYRLEMAPLNEATKLKLQIILDTKGLAPLTTVQNPFDLTPMASEVVYLEVIQEILSDEFVDVVVVAVVPLTPMLHTLPEEVEGTNDESTSILIENIAKLNKSTYKPIVIVVDSGHLYDPMADGFEKSGLPVFRSADICITVLGKYIQARLENKITS